MLKFLIIISAIISIDISAQIPLKIDKASTDVLLFIDQKKSFPLHELDLLNELINSEIDSIGFEREYLTTKGAFDSLKNSFIEFENDLKNIYADSAQVLFNQWYLHFNNVFYKYNKRNFFASNNKKIIFFSTSMSCYCTLEMCKKQLVDVIKLLSQKRGGCPCSGRQINTEKYDLLVVDAYEHNELQIKYETFISPSVIVLDAANRELLKIEYEENMIDQLKNYLRGEI